MVLLLYLVNQKTQKINNKGVCSKLRVVTPSQSQKRPHSEPSDLQHQVWIPQLGVVLQPLLLHPPPASGPRELPSAHGGQRWDLHSFCVSCVSFCLFLCFLCLFVFVLCLFVCFVSFCVCFVSFCVSLCLFCVFLCLICLFSKSRVKQTIKQGML